MTAIDAIESWWQYLAWADRAIVSRVVSEAVGGTPPEVAAVRETAHILGTEETWLARLQGRPPTLPVWPDTDARRLPSLLDAVHAACGGYFEPLEEKDLGRSVTYTNSAGAEFTSLVGDILVHVGLHGQYHRGKVNLLLRQAGLEPAPVDYIAWARRAPAATEADVAGSNLGGSI